MPRFSISVYRKWLKNGCGFFFLNNSMIIRIFATGNGRRMAEAIRCQ